MAAATDYLDGRAIDSRAYRFHRGRCRGGARHVGERSSGGTDIIVLVINKYRHITPGRTMLIVDLIIVGSSFFVFKSVETILFGIIIIAVMSTLVDWVLNGIRQSVQFFIFSSQYEEIATQINLQLHRDARCWTGWGGIPNNPKRYCWFWPREASRPPSSVS